MRVFSQSRVATQIVESLGAADVLITPEQARQTPPDVVLGAPAPNRFSGRVITFEPRTIDDMLDAVLRIGDALDRTADARRLVVALHERFDRAAEYVNAYEQGPTVAVLDLVDPIRVPGLWTAQLVERAGGRYPLNPTRPKPNAGAAAGPQQAERLAGPAVNVSADLFESAAPERLVIATGDLPRCRAAADTLGAQPWFADLPATRDAQIVLVDADAFGVPGPGLIDTFEWLVGWLQGRDSLIPDAFAWEPWSQSSR